MSKYTDYQAVVDTERGPVLDWRIELWSPANVLLATDAQVPADSPVIHWGATLQPMAFANDRVSQRSAELTVVVDDQLLVPDAVGSLLHPDSGNLVRISAGLWSPTGSQFWTLATLLVHDVEARYEGGATVLEVQLVDRTRPLDSSMVHGFSFTAGQPVESVVARILGEVYPTELFTVSPTGYTMPLGTFPSGSSRQELVTQMLEGCGHELVADAQGQIITRPIPPSTGDDRAERWVYGEGGIPITSAVRSWTIHTPQGWQVEGGSFADSTNGIEIVVWDQDPISQGYFAGEGETTIGTSRLPFVRTTGQAAVAGYAQLRRNGLGPVMVSFESVPNPAMAEGDLIQLNLPELRVNHLCRVIAFELPIHVESHMRVVARGVWDPQLGYNPPLDRNEGCLLSYTDGFDRPDQNLEDIPVGGGSPDWTEIGYSWGVVGNHAEQRYNGGWSLAIINTPLCSADAFCQIDVGKIPAGKFLGPCIRSSGAFDGYVAMADSSGNVSLQVWLNGARSQTLASHATGSSLEGKTLRIEAEGSTLRVLVGSETVITTTNDKRTGSYVGMVALGGQTGTTAPTVDQIEVGVL